MCGEDSLDAAAINDAGRRPPAYPRCRLIIIIVSDVLHSCEFIVKLFVSVFVGLNSELESIFGSGYGLKLLLLVIVCSSKFLVI